MPSRIRKFYQRELRALGLAEAAAGEFIDSAAQHASGQQSSTFPLAMAYAELRARKGMTSTFPKTFLCDAGLGGLARWLRAYGYAADWKPELDDAAVIREAQKLGSTLITTDSLMMERGVLRDRVVPSLFVPSSLTCDEQLVVVVREMALEPQPSRCMRCGGVLRQVPKEKVLDRIPPKTARWLAEYFLCDGCGELFWRGTHWQRISRKLLGDHRK